MKKNWQTLLTGFTKSHSTQGCLIYMTDIAWKVSIYGVFCGLYFPMFGLNKEIYSVNLRIQSEYKKIRTRKNFIFGYFWCNVRIAKIHEVKVDMLGQKSWTSQRSLKHWTIICWLPIKGLTDFEKTHLPIWKII